MKKTALVTGIHGQDGTYLAELLIAKNYHVIGIDRHNKPQLKTHKKIDSIELYNCDLQDANSITNIIKEIQPQELYHLASQSYPSKSWVQSTETTILNALTPQYIFDAVKAHCRSCRIYQASSSEMFGTVSTTPQNENTSFNPANPYAAAKVFAHQMAKIYRETYKLFISCGILFNHESPRRHIHFISQKICYAAACLKLGFTNSPLLNEVGNPIVMNGKLSLGNLNAQRDWGFAGDYVEAMWLMLQQDDPDDFVIGTGKLRNIKDLCEVAFSYVGLDWQEYIVSDKNFIRPNDTGPTVADSSKAKKLLGWEPKTSFENLIHNMVDKHLIDLQSSKEIKTELTSC